ncbi:helix-turn-helix domain-containing protein [Streptomyces sp. NEAU-H3]|uniref:helix-turn-helix domain-containing protein n=1 Tax=Streptomyces sp. NEAU-H3 TaxID=2720636 RepID=UPI00143AA7EB|nr:helix-turn-helix domain-containing protein [Streptomyces sp. NEAU-H3]NJA56709.1 helix-turn-helix domain-containing protein [Streptomyces sp. NEAU-H3]
MATATDPYTPPVGGSDLVTLTEATALLEQTGMGVAKKTLAHWVRENGISGARLPRERALRYPFSELLELHRDKVAGRPQ